MQPLEPLYLVIPGSEIAGLAALAGVVVVSSFAFNYAVLRFLLDMLKAQAADREVREKEADAMKAAANLATEILRDRRMG